MVTGLFFVVLGALVLLYPHILVFMCSGLLTIFGLGLMITGWQFRRLRKASESRFVNWITRY